MKRREFIFFSAVAGVWPLVARAQAKVPTVGLLWVEPLPYRKALLDALREKGYYADNQTIRFMDRTVREGYAQIADNARELVRAKVDVIVTYGATATTEAAKATKDIPIIMISGLDAVAFGWAASLAHPGGNVTGISTNSYQLTGKRVELIKELLPKLSQVGLLVAADSSVSPNFVRETEAMTRLVKLQSHIAEVHTPDDLERAFAALSRARVGALIVVPSTMLSSQAERVVALAAKHHLPAVYPTSQFANSGGLISYSADYSEQFRRLATYVDRVLKGAKPGDLPIEQPTKFEMVINLKTAKMLGIKIPGVILLRADKVIE
jgi:putative ABC transport system substrate-binding protein